MSKAILEFNLPEETEDFELATKAGAMAIALWDIRQEIFRPARKHGYPQSDIQELLDKLGEDGVELVSKLEHLFSDIIVNRNIPGDI